MDTAKKKMDTIDLPTCLRLYGSVTCTFQGISMLPMLREKYNDVVTIRAKGAQRCEKYDVALYAGKKDPNRFILHRIVEVTPAGYVFLGDNCMEREIVGEEQVIGVLSAFHRGKGGLLGNRDCSVDSAFYRAYAKLWYAGFPLRGIYKKCRSIAGSIYRKLRRK